MEWKSRHEILSHLSEAERHQYRLKENAQANQDRIRFILNDIETNTYIIEKTKDWLIEESKTQTDVDSLKEHLLIGAELIETCTKSNKKAQAEIANYIKYPLYSQKRRDWYKTKEGIAWLQEAKNRLKRN